ncbi:hypothetical protein MKX01_026263 [Papaver californicum]|nr:hypothetical protein MKX01_026263 [Papaver californicum]
MCDLTLQNLSGINVKITLWGDSTRELNRKFEQHDIEHTPVVVVVTGTYVKKYSTKIFFNLDLPEVIDMGQRGNLTAALLLFDNRKTISELLVAKWDAGCNENNKFLCRATANRLMTDGSWYYWGCSNCTTKLVGELGDQWCTKCESKIDDPTPKCCYRYPSATTYFICCMSTQPLLKPS